MNLALFKKAGTAAIADVFDTLGIEPPVLDNGVHWVAGAGPFAGPAYTVTGVTETFSGGDRLKLEAIDAMPPGVVAIWAAQGAQGVCCFGDLLATAMHARGCAAAVVDGGVRDVQFLETCKMPVMARYRTPAQGIGRWKVTAYQEAVQVVGGLTEALTITPGDLIVGDRDGVVVVPAALVSEVEGRLSAQSEAETGARKDIAAGMPLLAALAKYGHL